MAKLKIKDRGYWVSKLFYVRSWIQWFFSSIRFQSITFFSAVNPALHLGGMLDDRKSDIYNMLPEIYVPKTLLVRADTRKIYELVVNKKLDFPLIVKPDVGYKGFMVKRVENWEGLKEALKSHDEKEVLIQEFLDYKKEFSILFFRLPLSSKFGISSFVEKVLPFVVGDGSASLKELIEKNGSAFLDKDYVFNKYKTQLEIVLAKDQKMTVDHVGNYARGSKFYSRNDHIDVKLTNTFEKFFKHLDGINFSRIDLKANSIQDVIDGKFKVLEINGAKAEPLHMYEPSISWIKVWMIISDHWNILNSIVKEQLSLTFELPSAKDGIDAAKSLKRQTTN